MYDTDAMVNFPFPTPVLLILFVWSLIWKGFALWRAARLSQQNWFIAILVLNTAGILEIVYLFWFARERVRLDLSSLHLPFLKKKK